MNEAFESAAAAGYADVVAIVINLHNLTTILNTSCQLYKSITTKGFICEVVTLSTN